MDLFKPRRKVANHRDIDREPPESNALEMAMVPQTDSEKIQHYLAKKDSRLFTLMATLLDQNEDWRQQLKNEIDWRNADNCAFLLSCVVNDKVNHFILETIINAAHGNEIYNAVKQSLSESAHFYRLYSLEIQLFLMPFIGFEYVYQNTTTKRNKESRKLSLSDFKAADSISEKSFQIIGYITNLMQPYTLRRLHIESTFTLDDLAEQLTDLYNCVDENEDKLDVKETTKTLQRIPANMPALLPKFDEFLEYLKHHATQVEMPFIHNLLYFFQRKAIFHDTSESTIARGLKNITNYFDENTTSSPRLIHERVKPEIVLVQQCYFASLILMASHFSDKDFMHKNIRPHVNRILHCQREANASSTKTTKRKSKDYAAFNSLFTHFGELVHLQATLFIVEARMYENQQLQINVHQCKQGLKGSTDTIPHYLAFMSLLMSVLSEPEVDVLCYNPDFCVQLYRGYLMRHKAAHSYPPLVEVNANSVCETTERLASTELETLQDKCRIYAAHYDVIRSMKAHAEEDRCQKIQALLCEKIPLKSSTLSFSKKQNALAMKAI